jgi:hypothetical protein
MFPITDLTSLKEFEYDGQIKYYSSVILPGNLFHLHLYKEYFTQNSRDFKRANDSVTREVLYNIVTGFGIPMKLVGLIEICLN